MNEKEKREWETAVESGWCTASEYLDDAEDMEVVLPVCVGMLRCIYKRMAANASGAHQLMRLMAEGMQFITDDEEEDDESEHR